MPTPAHPPPRSCPARAREPSSTMCSPGTPGPAPGARAARRGARSRVAGALVVGALLPAAACLPGGRLPTTPRGAALSPLQAAHQRDSGPFRVTFSGPEGGGHRHPEPTLVFSRPVRALSTSPTEPVLPAVITPAVEGRWEWVGTSAARFVPAGRFPLATEYRVDVPATVRSLDGASLSAHSFSFTTSRPGVERTSPSGDGGRVERGEPIELTLGQPVATSELASAVTLTDDEGRPLPFRLEQALRDGAADPLEFRLFPREPFPYGIKIRLHVSASLRGLDGPLTAGAPLDRTFETRGPLEVSGVRCTEALADGRCTSSASVQIDLTDDIEPSRLRRLIDISPPLAFELDAYDDTASSRHTLGAAFRVGVPYRVRIRPEAARPGQAIELPLAKGGEAVVRFAERAPGASFVFSDGYLPLAARHPMVLSAVNTERVRVRALPLSAGQVASFSSRRPLPAELDALAGVRAIDLDVHGPRDASERRALPLARLLPDATAPGPFLLSASWAGRDGEEHDSAIVRRTDLALVTDVSPEGALVWVTRLSTGEPVVGAEIEVRGPGGSVGSATTGEGGVATVASSDYGLGAAALRALRARPAAGEQEAGIQIAARLGEDRAFQAARLPRAARPVGFVYTDRGIYHPGETVNFSAVLRRPGSSGLAPPAGETVRVKVRQQGSSVAELDAKLSAFGVFSSQATLRPDTPLGAARVEVELDGTAISTWFEVAAYRPASFGVEIATDRPEYVRGDALRCSFAGRYLSGSPMTSGWATATLDRAQAQFHVPGLSGYVIDDGAAPYVQLRPPGGPSEDRLDAQGKGALTATLDQAGQRGPERITCEASIQDPARESLTTRASAVVHPGEHYVAIASPLRYELAPGETFSPGVLAVTPAGERRAVKVDLTLAYRPQQPAGPRGASAPERIVASCSVTTGNTPASCGLRAPSGPFAPGDRFAVTGSSVDARGNLVRASIELWPGARRPTPPTPAPRRAAPPPSLAMDAEEYREGQAAIATLTPPFRGARALMRLEREGVLWHKVVQLDREPMRIPVPLGVAVAPAATLRVSFEAPASADGRAHPHASARTRFEYAADASELVVDLTPSRRQAQPGDEIELEATVTSKAGEPARAEVTLYAADEASLSLSGYRVPDGSALMAPRSRQWLVDGYDARDHVIHPPLWRRSGTHVPKPPQVRMGATSVSRDRQDFKQTAFFLSGLVTDEHGRVRARVKLPEGLTTYRLMAVAVGEREGVGSARSAVTTSKPLMVRPALPRVIRAGDRFFASAVVTNNTGEPRDVAVSIEPVGFTPVGEPGRSMQLAAGESRETSFLLEAPAATRGQITLRARSGEHEDGASLPAPVIAPISPEAAALYGEVEGRADEQVGDLGAIRSDVGGLEITLSSSPLVGLAAGFDQLIEYPHGCTEQTTSRLVPLLALRDLATSVGARMPADADAAAASAIKRVLSAQHPSGAFGLWPASRSTSPWLTAYALWGLLEAGRRGVEVPPAALARALVHARSRLEAWDESPAATATAPFLLDVLAQVPAPSPVDSTALGRIGGELFGQRASMPLFSRALLLHALAAIGAGRPEVDALVSDVAGRIRLDGPVARVVPDEGRHDELFDSSGRTSALLLRALLSAAPAHPMIEPLAAGLLADRRGGAWRSTQEAAWALLALDDYRRARAPAALDVSASVLLGGEPIGQANFHQEAGAPLPRDVRFELPASRLAAASGKPLVFSLGGPGRLGYQARLRAAPAALPDAPLSAGFEVQRRCAPVKGDGPPESRPATTRFEAGALLFCELTVISTSPRRFVVIEDPLPGGIEAVEFELRRGASAAQALEAGSYTRRELRDDRVVYFVDELPGGVHRFRYVARATTRGTFVAPPARAEDMYAPEVFGRTAAGHIEVVAAAP
jgi:alpha-2-macroglobulin